MHINRWLGTVVLGLTPLAGAHAATVFWTDWTSASGSLVSGSLTTPDGVVGVTASGPFGATQTSGGTNYWSPNTPYLSADVSNAPPASDIIQLAAGGTETISFSQAVVDPLIALVSWNGNTVTFSAPIEILSYGAGYWGNGTPVLNPAGDGFYGNGEVHGVVRLKGTFTSLSFTHTSESWHGFTVGITQAVPEPNALWLALAALPVVGWRYRPQRRTVA